MPEYQLRQGPDGMFMNIPIYSDEELAEIAEDERRKAAKASRKPKSKPVSKEDTEWSFQLPT